MPSITITLTDVAEHGRNVNVQTTEPAPEAGAPLSPAQALALDLMTLCKHKSHRVAYSCAHSPADTLVRDLLDPERFAFAVTGEVRNEARRVRGTVFREGGKS